MIHGGQLKVTGASGCCAMSKSCEVTYECDIIEITPQAGGTAREFVAGRTSWTVTVSGLMSSINFIFNVRTTYTLTITDGTTSYTGQAICRQAKMTGVIGNLAQRACVFQGTGALSPAT